ncbi:MAG TPA: Ig-like domain-containing protein, partial [Anaerolineales bacterium]|nr:Ig-like domain-containing protein [Anaerolineales bacterium]
NILTFTPIEPLKAGENFTFFIDPALSSSEGKVFDTSPQWNIQVIGGAQVVSVSPKAGLLTTRKPLVEVIFDGPMEHSSTEQSFAIQPSVPYKLVWKNDQEIQIQFNDLLEYGQQYTFQFTGGSADNAAKDKSGTPLAEDFNWSYGLETFSVEVPQTDEKAIRINFSHTLDTGRTGFPFAISPHLAGKWRWQGNKTALFISEEEIPLGQVFSFSIIKPLFDEDGEIRLNSTLLNFMAPPPISSVEPLANSNPVPAGFSPIKITFETEVNQNSAEKAFSIEPQVEGRFEWSKSKSSSFENVLLFYPNKLLQNNTPYTIQLDTGLTDAKGAQLLLERYTSTFSTTYEYYGYTDEASFGYGSKIQVLDVLGRRRIQFGGGESESITFEAYAYDLIDFASLYADYVSGKGILIPARSEKEPVASWNYVEVNPDYQETIVPPDVPPGLYVLNLRYGGRSYDQLFVALTRNTIVAKQAGDELFVWVTNINGGEVPEAEIRVYADRGEKIREGKTDENGLYRVSIPDGYQAMLVSARTGEKNNDIAVTGLDGRWQEYASGYWSRWSESHKYFSYIYTDRPIYRPGQTVNFKAIVRRDQDLKYSVPDVALPITVNIRDAKNNLLQTNTFTANEFGTINGT